MKIFNRLLTLLILSTIVGCNDSDSPQHDAPINIPLDPSKYYIHFDADIDTRGALVDGTLLLANFSAVGYQFSGTWSAEKAMASPNVFATPSEPQLVTYDGSVFNYTPIQPWTGNQYSFFGYYPASHDNIKFFDNGTAKSGEPYITYTLVSRTSSVGHIDVMTAANTDTGVASSSTVGLEFHHRLAAIDVGARNYYMHTLDDGTEVPVTIEITELDIVLNNLVNESAKIYLDHRTPSEYTATNESNRRASYPMVSAQPADHVRSVAPIEPNTEDDRAMRFITLDNGDNASAMLVIPQKEDLEVGGKLEYKKKYTDSDGTQRYIPNPNGGDTFKKDDLYMVFNKKLQEGRRYFIEFTFTSDAISINVVAADEWTDLDVDDDGIEDDIDYDFE